MRFSGTRPGWVVLAFVACLLAVGCGGAADADDVKPLTATGPAPPGAITWSGWHWQVKVADEPVGPGPNRFGDAGNVEVGADGALRLRITRDGEMWRSAEVFATDSLGYGTYRWELDLPGTPAEPNAVLGLFTWSDEPAFAHREIDVELSQFRRPDVGVGGQFVVQPHDQLGNLQQFAAIGGVATVGFTWRPSVVRFTAGGAEPGAWTFTGPGVPTPGGGVHPRMNLWLLAGDAPAAGEEVEVTIRSFTFVPESSR